MDKKIPKVDKKTIEKDAKRFVIGADEIIKKKSPKDEKNEK